MSKAKVITVKEKISYEEKGEVAFSFLAVCFFLETIVLRNQIATLDYTWQLSTVLILQTASGLAMIYFWIKGACK